MGRIDILDVERPHRVDLKDTFRCREGALLTSLAYPFIRLYSADQRCLPGPARLENGCFAFLYVTPVLPKSVRNVRLVGDDNRVGVGFRCGICHLTQSPPECGIAAPARSCHSRCASSTAICELVDRRHFLCGQQFAGFLLLD